MGNRFTVPARLRPCAHARIRPVKSRRLQEYRISPGSHAGVRPEEPLRLVPGDGGHVAEVGIATAHASLGVRELFLLERLGGEQDGAVERVRQATVPAADLHRDDNQLREGLELAGERGVDVGVAQGQADRTVCRDDFEQDGEQRECVLVRVFQTPPFHDGDDEEPQEHVPQVETQLLPQVCSNVAGLPGVFRVFILLGRGIDTETLLFVDVGPAHGDGDREDRNVHHDKVRNLNGRVQLGEVDTTEAGRPRRCSLEPTVHDTYARADRRNIRVVQLWIDCQSGKWEEIRGTHI